MEQPRPDRDTIRRRTIALPFTEGEELLSETSALTYFEDLRQNNPKLFQHINEQIAIVDKTLANELGAMVDPIIRRGIIGRAAIAAAAQVANDAGKAILDINQLQGLFSGELTIDDDKELGQPEDPTPV